MRRELRFVMGCEMYLRLLVRNRIKYPELIKIIVVDSEINFTLHKRIIKNL